MINLYYLVFFYYYLFLNRGQKWLLFFFNKTLTFQIVAELKRGCKFVS